MKILGALLILLGAFCGYVVYQRSSMQVLCLSKALADDLAVLRCRICTQRRTLPSVLACDLAQGACAPVLWIPLAHLLEQSEGSVRTCWQTASEALPEPLGRCVSPLGALLPAGGETLSNAVEEARREILAFAGRQQEQQPLKLRLAAAMCFSSAALFILVCI